MLNLKMRTRDELQRLYAQRTPAPLARGSVDLLVIRTAPNSHETPSAVEVTRAQGAVGDRWVNEPIVKRDVERQLTLMMTSVAELVCDGQPLHLPGDNLLVNLDLGSEALLIGSRLRVGDALLEVTPKPHTGCKKFLARFGEGAFAWINDEDGRARKLRGINCKVIDEGTIRVGDIIERVVD
jgi:MOSC domain-containing protein YiiM